MPTCAAIPLVAQGQSSTNPDPIADPRTADQHHHVNRSTGSQSWGPVKLLDLSSLERAQDGSHLSGCNFASCQCEKKRQRVSGLAATWRVVGARSFSPCCHSWEPKVTSTLAGVPHASQTSGCSARASSRKAAGP